MMTIALGGALGVLGAAWHLAVTRWRARLVVRGGAPGAWLALPLGLAGPALAILAAWVFADRAGLWSAAIGAVAMSAVGLAWVGAGVGRARGGSASERRPGEPERAARGEAP